MASANFYRLFVNFMLIALVIFGLFVSISTIQQDNNVEDKFTDSEIINNTYGSLEEDLDDLRDQSQGQKTLFESETPTSGFGTILLFSIVSSGKVFNAMTIGVFNTLIRLPVVILGMDPIIVGLLGTLMIITIILGLWAIYKLGG